jgi:hypothetical protein
VSGDSGGGRVDAVGVALGRDHELGEIAVADDPPEPLLGDAQELANLATAVEREVTLPQPNRARIEEAAIVATA